MFYEYVEIKLCKFCNKTVMQSCGAFFCSFIGLFPLTNIDCYRLLRCLYPAIVARVRVVFMGNVRFTLCFVEKLSTQMMRMVQIILAFDETSSTFQGCQLYILDNPGVSRF